MDGGVLNSDSVFAGFRIDRLLAEGASARVYLARDATLERNVALKVFKAGVTEAPHVLREAQLVARLDHPHIVRVLHFGTENGCPFLVLEYVPGATLAETLRERTLDDAMARVVATEILEGLRYLHAQGVVHGDLKPENVILPPGNRVRLIDFGLAAAAGQRAEGRGTEDWLSPQCWLPHHQLSSADDLWALGVMLSTLINGKPPWPAGEVSRAAFARVALEPPRLGGPLGPLATRCLAWDPSQRPTAAEALDVLHRLDLETNPPFRGLAPFSERERDDFQGRDTEAARALELLARNEPVVISGPSGVGKSSFAHARLVPRLRETRPRALTVLSLRPGAHPLRTLALALGDEALAAQLEADPARLAALLRNAQRARRGELLVLVDQFEEVFTLASEEDQARFCHALSAAAGIGDGVGLLLLVRDEFLGRLFQTSLAASRLAVLGLRPLSEAELEAAITEPLRRVGATLDPPTLARRIATDVAQQPAPLPLLQFACRALWERRGDRLALSGAEYDRLGGAAGVLASHAQSFLASLDAPTQALVRTLLLTAVNADGTRRPVPRAHLPDASLVDRLIERRLFVARDEAGEPIVELAHESLATMWPELRRWLRESTDAHRLQTDVETSAERWERLGRREADAWREDVSLTHQRLDALPLSARAAGFLHESQVLRERESRRRRTVSALVVLLALVVTAGALTLAWRFRENERRAIAQQNELREIAENLGDIRIVFTAVDWDGKTVTPATLDGLGHAWRLWAVDPDDPHRPKLDRPIAVRDLTVSGQREVSVSFLAPGGSAFLEVFDRGGVCPSSWVRLNALHGYAQRRQGLFWSGRVVVPTCHASSVDEVEVRPGLWLDRTEEPNALYEPFEAMKPAHRYERAWAPNNSALEHALEPNFPISGVDWATAGAFCRWLGKRLPTLAEWREAALRPMTGVPRIDSPTPVAADDPSLDVTTQGIRSLGGNMREWTATLEADSTRRMVMVGGGDWGAPLGELQTLEDGNPNVPVGTDFGMGVRCARRLGTEW
jgi:hypothetical protein